MTKTMATLEREEIPIPGTEPTEGADRQVPASGSNHAKVVALTGLLWIASASGAVWLARLQDWGVSRAWPWLIAFAVLAPLFAATEIFVVHLQINGEAHTVSLVELPLALGLFFAAPWVLIASQAIGALLALTLHRRQPPLKLLFNLASLTTSAVVAVAIFRASTATTHPLDELTLLTGSAALLTQALLSSLLVFLVISVSSGAWHLKELRAGVLFGFMTSLFTASLGVIATIVIASQPGLTWLLAVPTGGIYVANWAYTAQRRRHEGLEFLYRATKHLHESPDTEAGIRELLHSACETFRAGSAELVYLRDSDQAPIWVRVGRASHTTQDGDDALVALFMSGMQSDPADYPHGPRAAFLERRGYRDAIIVPLSGERRVLGGLVIAEPLSDVAGFDENDMRLAQTLANHTAIALENGRLEQSLQQLRVLEQRLTFQATHDPLTELANRNLFRNRLAEAVSTQPVRGAVLFVDLDDFKAVNDTFGHAAGDALLKGVAARLSACVRPDDTVARLGGDEFALLLTGVVDSADADAAAGRVLHALEAPIPWRDRPLQVRASVGIALIHSDGNPEALMRDADTAMYIAKAHGKHRFVTFEPAMRESTVHRFNLQADLQIALARGELVTEFQPIVGLDSGELIGAEALVRWDHPTLGRLAPASFLPVASDSDLVAIDTVVLELACRWIAEIDATDPLLVPWVSVNVSPVSFRQSGLLDRVRSVLDATGLDPQRLRIEVTEDLLINEDPEVIDLLHAFDALGIALALDDFGTGFSSLSQLRVLPADVIKIAKPFIDELDVSREQEAFVGAIIMLARTLKRFTIAEGIERPEQLDVLRRVGCDAGQGFFFARPMDPAAFMRWARSTRKTVARNI